MERNIKSRILKFSKGIVLSIFNFFKYILKWMKGNLSNIVSVITILSFLFAVMVFTYGICDYENIQNEKFISRIDSLIFELSFNLEKSLKIILVNEESYIKNKTVPILRLKTDMINDIVKSGEIRSNDIKYIIFEIKSKLNYINDHLDRADQALVRRDVAKLNESMGHVLALSKGVDKRIPVLITKLNEYKDNQSVLPVYCIFHD